MDKNILASMNIEIIIGGKVFSFVAHYDLVFCITVAIDRFHLKNDLPILVSRFYQLYIAFSQW